MNHSNTLPFQSNRLASRHWHRHFAQASVPSYPGLPLFTPMTAFQSLTGEADAADGGALLRAERRIAELEKSLEEARNAAFSDPLTGALNRRGFESAYAREMARSRRNGERLSLAMIDLDDFKAINDRYGHLAGDKVLVRLVRVLRDSMRSMDVLCRFGGEEFVLMLPNTPVDDACQVARRILSEFSSAVPDRAQTVTFSAGVVCHDYFESLDEALRRADAATYAAKRAGKNRIMPG